jgi:hypothetical protein
VQQRPQGVAAWTGRSARLRHPQADELERRREKVTLTDSGGQNLAPARPGSEWGCSLDLLRYLADADAAPASARARALNGQLRITIHTLAHTGRR